MDESIISRAQLQEFRDLVKVLYPPNATSAKPTPEILAHPLYPRYKMLSPLFYSAMLSERRKRGLRT